MTELVEYTLGKDLNTSSDQPLVSTPPRSTKSSHPYLKLKKDQSQGKF